MKKLFICLLPLLLLTMMFGCKKKQATPDETVFSSEISSATESEISDASDISSIPESSDGYVIPERKKKPDDSIVGADEIEMLEALPFSVKNQYRIEDSDTFAYIIKVDAASGRKLIGKESIMYLCDNDPPLLMSTMSLTEIEKLCNSLGVKVLDKCDDYTQYSGLRKNSYYGIIYLYNEVN